MARIFITGSVDGLGFAAAKSLLESGHGIVLHARSSERGLALSTLTGAALGIVIGDLRSAAETRAVANQVNDLGPMDAIIHNAGIYTEPRRGSTPEGHPTTLAVNTLAPYILTALIHRPRRLIYLSSGLHRGGQGSLSDLAWNKRSWDPAKAYAETKLHVVALAAALARRWPDVITSAVDPGWVRTKMGGSGAPVDLDTGQRTQTWLAVSDDPAALRSGGYWHNCRLQAPAEEATNAAFQDQFMEQVSELTGTRLP